MENQQEIINSPIGNLPVGEEIQNLCIQLKFNNLGEFLKNSDYDMIHKLGLSYHAVIELFGYLQSMGLGDLMDYPTE